MTVTNGILWSSVKLSGSRMGSTSRGMSPPQREQTHALFSLNHLTHSRQALPLLPAYLLTGTLHHLMLEWPWNSIHDVCEEPCQ